MFVFACYGGNYLIGLDGGQSFYISSLHYLDWTLLFDHVNLICYL